jgi:signal transduction histidine kinase/CheY-like chemotaxis protein/HAMP domain-containing protein
MQAQLIIIFLLVKVIPLIIITVIAWNQIVGLGELLKVIAVTDSSDALNANAVENIERMSTDTAREVADFLYSRDDDILFVARMEPTEENYRLFAESRVGRLVKTGDWTISEDGTAWVPAVALAPAQPGAEGRSTNPENNDVVNGSSFHYREPDAFLEPDNTVSVPLYDEVAFVGLDGRELVKYVAPDSTKTNYPFDPALKDVSDKWNTYIHAETYFEELKNLKPGEIYVSDVIGAYVGSNYIGMYTPDVVAAADKGYDIPYDPEAQAYAGEENPIGQRFEGIVRWATPVTDENGVIAGYVTFALNHDHIMEFVDHLTPMNERYTELPSAFEGNYAFIWDYQCRSIAHPRHHSIVGFDPETGDPAVPWLETSIYEAWQTSGVANWSDFIERSGWAEFDGQSRAKKPAAALTQAGLLGLDGRYLNNAPQCTGWMDLTRDGGSGSFYILWSGIYKPNTAAAIPYYTGHYAPSEENGYSRRGFGFVAIGAGIEDFTRPAKATEEKLAVAIRENLSGTSLKLVGSTVVIIALVVLIAIWMASFITGNITRLIRGVSRFRRGERQFRFDAPVKNEFGTLADSFDDMADSIVDSVKTPLSITDMAQKIIYMNDYGLEFSGKTLDKIVGAPYAESSIYPSGSKYCPITALEAGGEAETYYAEDMGRYVKGAASYFLSKEGAKIGYIITTTDVTDMIATQTELERAVEDANRANEHKGQFLARMSHEIRTPMNAIIGLTGIVLRKLGELGGGDAVGEVHNHVSQIEVSSQHLLGLLNDILDITKIEAGKIDISEEAVELPKLFETVAGIIRPRCDEKNITFDTHIGAFDTATFIGDSLRLRQVLINLLGNAVKFTPELGRIEFRVEQKDRRDGRTLVRYSVRDTGIGISREKLDSIFAPFEQGDAKITRQFGGTGLGLAISQRIVQLFGGDIAVESQEGEGSTFSFEVWMRETESDLPEEATLEDATGKFTGKRALLVDDVEINRTIVMAMLETTGLAIDEAEDGVAAVEKFRESPEGTYGVVFMDVQMPKLDGYGATAQIRKLDRSDARTVPIIALTANAFKDDIDRAIKAGMNAHLAKPIEMDGLVGMLFRYLK